MEREPDEDTLVGPRPSLTEPNGLSLVVVSPGGTRSVPLPDRGVVSLGRSPDCEVSIPDPKLSRRHAEIRSGDGIFVIDLGSRNGTLVRDERIPSDIPVALREGDSVSLGATVVLLQRTVPGLARPRNVWSHGYFEARLEEECSGSSADSTFAIVRVRLDAPLPVAKVAEPPAAPHALVAWLRPTDTVALYAPNDYEVLLPKTSVGDAEARASRLAAELTKAGIAFRMAIATYPRDGVTPEGLIARTSGLLHRDPEPTTGSVSERKLVPTGALRRLEPIVARVAAGVISVLVLGETGVGKELLSRRIHELSPRAERRLVSLNCAALSESLLESELFGHEKGAFTGASHAKPGLLESADGGTVFLDEIGEMPLSLQAKLLRVIEQREVMRVGALRPRAIDVRFVSATHRDIQSEIAQGRFRQDLYFRLSGVTLAIPPLRERVEEIEPLALTFVEQSCLAMRRTRIPRIADDALDTLRRYQWPGNIRELRNVIERAVLLSSGDVIAREHLPVEKLGEVIPPSVRYGPQVGARMANAAPTDAVEGRVLSPLPASPPAPLAPAPIGEHRRILEALEQFAGNQSQAARELGMSRQTLIRRLEEYGIPRPRKRD